VTDIQPAGAEATGAAQFEATSADMVAASRPLRVDVWRRFKENRLALFGLAFVLLLVLMAVFADVIAPYGFAERTRGAYRQPPSSNHWFGTDTVGRDVFSRVVYGARVSLRIALLLGAVAGFFGGLLETLIMRLTDVFLSIPYIVLAVAIASVLARSENTVIVVLGLTGWLGVCRIVRASFLQLKRQEYVEAATALGYSRSRIMFRHMLPNALQPIIVYGTVTIGTVILAEAALSFLGVGPRSPTPAWGLMVNEAGAGSLASAPHMLFFPGLAIFFTVLAFVFIGDGLRDALDPKLK
jgi:peptide/nickel transport system permease protein